MCVTCQPLDTCHTTPGTNHAPTLSHVRVIYLVAGIDDMCQLQLLHHALVLRVLRAANKVTHTRTTL